MPALNRRQFLIATAAAGAARALPATLSVARQRRVLTLVYDKALGAMRAIDRVVP
ncbi:MAG: Tat pathway signal protein [Roseivivax sp.]|nr:Tat pathway signal protein [Roseivivax sp.]